MKISKIFLNLKKNNYNLNLFNCTVLSLKQKRIIHKRNLLFYNLNKIKNKKSLLKLFFIEWKDLLKKIMKKK